VDFYDKTGSSGGSTGTIERLLDDLDQVLSDQTEPAGMFSEFTRCLEREFDISKGFLAIREGDHTRFMAVATFIKGKTRKNLSLRVPSMPSLFEQVSESGQIYSDSFAELFDGNLIEKRLIIDDDTISFMLRPLKHEGTVVGLIGYSSDVPEAFVVFEEGLLNPAFDRLASLLGNPEATGAKL
jgi:hypothetical protein